MKPHRLLLLLAVLAAAVPARADRPATAPAPRPSILLIQCHDLARGDLSCYGQTNFQTPNLDRLAQEGIRFTHYTGGADSAATTAELLAGTITAPAAEEANLAQRLRASGYHTGLIGEWSQGGPPWTHGFDEFAGFLEDAEGTNYFPEYVWRHAPKSIYNETTKTFEAFTGKESLYPNLGGKQGQYLPEVLTKAMVNFVRVNEPDAANQFRPFFLLVNLPAPRSATAGADHFPVPSDAPFTGEAWPQAAKDRAALITRLDSNIGRLFEQLNKMKQSNNVAIFFTASSAPEPFANTNLNFLLPAGDFRRAHPAPALPLLARWPQQIPGGRVSNAKCSVLDLTPTALALGQIKPAEGMTGISLLPNLLGATGQIAPDVTDPRKPQGE